MLDSCESVLPPKANGILRAEYNEDRSCATARNEGENEVRGVAVERAEARGRKGAVHLRACFNEVYLGQDRRYETESVEERKVLRGINSLANVYTSFRL